MVSRAPLWLSTGLACYSAYNAISPLRLSVTGVDQSKTVELRIVQFSPYSSAILLVFAG